MGRGWQLLPSRTQSRQHPGAHPLNLTAESYPLGERRPRRPRGQGHPQANCPPKWEGVVDEQTPGPPLPGHCLRAPHGHQPVQHHQHPLPIDAPQSPLHRGGHAGEGAHQRPRSWRLLEGCLYSTHLPCLKGTGLGSSARFHPTNSASAQQGPGSLPRYPESSLPWARPVS